MMITIAIHLPNAWHGGVACVPSTATGGGWLAQHAPVSVEMAPLVLQATAAPAAFIPTQLVAGAGHDRRRHGWFRPEPFKPWTPFRCSLLAPGLGLVGIALLGVQVRQTLQHVGAVL